MLIYKRCFVWYVVALEVMLGLFLEREPGLDLAQDGRRRRRVPLGV